MLFIDIGGHVGVYTEAFARCPGVHAVYVFEPNPVNLQVLHEKFDTNSNVHIIPCAVGATNGHTKLYRFPDDLDKQSYNTGRSSILENNTNISRSFFYDVPIIKLSTFLQDNQIHYVDCMKIDVEGAEYDILEDLMDTGMINNIHQIILSEHRFLFYGDYLIRAEQILQRLKREYMGRLQLEQ